MLRVALLIGAAAAVKTGNYGRGRSNIRARIDGFKEYDDMYCGGSGHEKSPSTAEECATECEGDANCVAFNYFGNGKQCRIINLDPTGDKDEHHDWVCYEKIK